MALTLTVSDPNPNPNQPKIDWMQLSVSVMEDLHDVRRSIMSYKQFFRAYFVYSTYWTFWESVKRIFLTISGQKPWPRGCILASKVWNAQTSEGRRDLMNMFTLKAATGLHCNKEAFVCSKKNVTLKKKLCIREFYAEKQRNEPTLR